MQIDAWERGFSYSFDAPLDMRMDPDAELDARDDRQRVAREPDRRDPPQLRRRAARPLDRPPDRRRAARSRRPPSSSRPSAPACRRRPASAAATPPSAPSRRSGSPSTASSRRSTPPCPQAWDLLAPGGRLAAISFHSLEDRRVKRFLVDRARGCICPPEFPVCRCGLEPEAELITKGGVAPERRRDRRQPALRLGPPAGRAASSTDRGGRLMGAPGDHAEARAPAPKAAPSRRSRDRRPKARPRRSRVRAAARPRSRASSVAAAASRRCRSRVGGIADCGFVIGMARSRVWIGVLGVLLGGIVAINVCRPQPERRAAADRRPRSTSCSATTASSASRLAQRLSNERISRPATRARPRRSRSRRRPLPGRRRRRRRAGRRAPRRRLDRHRAAGAPRRSRGRRRPTRRRSPGRPTTDAAEPVPSTPVDPPPSIRRPGRRRRPIPA